MAGDAVTWSDLQRERWLTGLRRLGLDPEVFAAWCSRTGRPSPETWDEPRRYRALVWLSERAHRAQIVSDLPASHVLGTEGET